MICKVAHCYAKLAHEDEPWHSAVEFVLAWMKYAWVILVVVFDEEDAQTANGTDSEPQHICSFKPTQEFVDYSSENDGNEI